MRGLRESAWIWIEIHHEVLLSVPKSPTDTPAHYRGAQGAALPPLPHPKEKLLSNFPNSLKQTLSPVQSCSRSESLGELPWLPGLLDPAPRGRLLPQPSVRWFIWGAEIMGRAQTESRQPEQGWWCPVHCASST